MNIKFARVRRWRALISCGAMPAARSHHSCTTWRFGLPQVRLRGSDQASQRRNGLGAGSLHFWARWCLLALCLLLGMRSLVLAVPAGSFGAMAPSMASTQQASEDPSDALLPAPHHSHADCCPPLQASTHAPTDGAISTPNSSAAAGHHGLECSSGAYCSPACVAACAWASYGIALIPGVFWPARALLPNPARFPALQLPVIAWQADLPERPPRGAAAFTA